MRNSNHEPVGKKAQSEREYTGHGIQKCVGLFFMTFFLAEGLETSKGEDCPLFGALMCP